MLAASLLVDTVPATFRALRVRRTMNTDALAALLPGARRRTVRARRGRRR